MNKFSKTLESTFWILIGSIFLSVGFILFISPYNIVPGGSFGLAVVLREFFPDMMVGTLALFINIPLLILSFCVLGKEYGIKTLVASLIIPLIMNLVTKLVGGSNPAEILGGTINLSDDKLLSSLFGGVLIGTGLGLIIKNRSSSGGTDVISLIICKYTGKPYAKVMLFVESMVIVAGLIVFGSWKLPLYSLITIFVASKVIDIIVEGGASTDKLLFIITDKKQEVKEYVLNELRRGGTFIKASGMYSENDKNMIFVVVSRNQLATVKERINEIDENSFLTIVNANEIMGKGFKSFKPIV